MKIGLIITLIAKIANLFLPAKYKDALQAGVAVVDAIQRDKETKNAPASEIIEAAKSSANLDELRRRLAK
ncbi:MAG TPA: hypothetical protein PKX94_05675 [Opitutales bacterium]|nr:hypothetical protein [Opitutales bacterium]